MTFFMDVYRKLDILNTIPKNMLIVTLLAMCFFGHEAAFLAADKVAVSSETAQELMVKITELEENTDKNGSGQVTSKPIEELTKNHEQECQDLKTAECVELIKERIRQINANSKIHQKKSARILVPYMLCFDGSSLIQYNPETQLCCYGKITRSKNRECCNEQVINTKEQFCCNGMVRNNSGSSACCGDSMYETDTHMCCNGGMVHEKFDDAECCNHMIYNKSSQVCCYERNVFNKTEGDSCCGDKIFNSSTHVCCGTNILPSYSGTRRKTDLCCGDKLYNAKCSMCVDGMIIPIQKDKLCCDGVFEHRYYGNYSACCFHKVMNILNESCVDNRIYPILLYGNGIDADIKGTKDVVIEYTTPSFKVKSGSRHVTLVLVTTTGLIASLVICTSVVIICYRRKKHITHRNECTVSETLLATNPTCTDEQTVIDEKIPFTNSCESGLTKETLYPQMNLTSEYHKNSATQTCPKKVSNRRNIFGKNFDFVEHLTGNNNTLQMPNSEVKMTLPTRVLTDGGVEVNSSTYRSLPELYEKFDISQDNVIASPAVEYILTGHTDLPYHAVVIMPFIGDEADLKVWKFRSDDGSSSPVDTFEVLRQGKTNEELDLFYNIRGNFVHIYTKSFSGFYCTTCKHSRELRLHAYVFGSYKRFLQPLRYEVRMEIYIADEILKFEDYNEGMKKSAEIQGKILKREKEIKLPEQMKGIDKLLATLTPTVGDDDMWIHKPHHKLKTRPTFEATQAVELSNIAVKCETCSNGHVDPSKKPYCIEWYMCTKENKYPSYTFQCVIDIEIPTEKGKELCDSIVIDELQLRQEDRVPIEEDYHTRCIRGVKEYLACGIEPDKRAELLRKLGDDANVKGETVEDIFFYLQQHYSSKGLLEKFAKIMKDAKMFDHLDKLTNNGLLPRTVLQYPVQPATIDVPPAIIPWTANELRGAEGNPHQSSIAENGHLVKNLVTTNNSDDFEEIHPELSRPNYGPDTMEPSTLCAKNDLGSVFSSNEYQITDEGLVRREMDSHAVNSINTDHVADDNPVQEVASADLTYPKYE
ncbi:hypothetical protein ACF0H5_018128 [Mactra antiquata]